MPYRRPKRPYILPVVTTLAVTAPLAALVLHDTPGYRSTNESDLTAIPAQLAEVGLASAPDVVLPLRELTGLDLPDLHLSDLRKLPLPRSLPVPAGLPAPPGVQLPSEIPLPQFDRPEARPTPAARPGAGTSTGFIDAPLDEPAPSDGPENPSAATDSGAPTSAAPAPDPANAPAPGPADPAAPAPTAPADPAPADAAAPAPADAAAPAPANPAGPAPVPNADPATPALAPGAIGPELADRVGAEVKELTRETPFSMVALTAKDLGDTKAMVRARTPDGSWGPWFSTERVDTRADDRSTAPVTGTEPVYVGKTNAVQVLTTRKAAAPALAPAPASAPGSVSAPASAPAPAPARGDDPAQMAAAGLSAVLIDPGRGAVDENLSNVAGSAPGGGPKVITRAQWGADESIRCEEPHYDDGLGGITVHHTAGRNDYSKAESAGIVRAIYAYHAKTLGWCDIGYNALVDKYGQVFEGRYGGLDKPVQGAHAGGFNENTSGVALMGDFETEPPTDAAIQATGQFIGWRARAAGLDPTAKTTMYSEGTEFTPYAKDEAVQLPTVFAHRDVGNTSCPGDAAYALMDRIREIAANSAGTPNTRTGESGTRAGGNGTPGTNGVPGTQRTQSDLATLADLTGRLMQRVGDNVIAQYWAGQGGADGHLGAAASEPQPTGNGGQYAKFVNGYVYATPDGNVVEVAGHILDRFLQLGAESGVLGMPLRNAYPVPDGLRADFQYGSLILNQVSGIVSTLLQNYSNADPQNPVTAPIPGQAAAPAPAENPASAPAEAPAPAATNPTPEAPAEQASPEQPTPADPPVS